MTAWSAYADLMRRGRDLVKGLHDLGPAGIQAYFIQNAAGKFGPYQFEERVNLGGTVFFARRIGAAAVEVFDSRTNALMGRGEGPRGVVVRVAGEGDQSYDTAVRTTEHTDELRVKLDYLLTQAREQVGRLGSAAGSDAPSWAGRFLAVLTRPESIQAVTDYHRRSRQVWKALVLDLVALGKLKERLATYHLLERLAEFVPQLMGEQAAANAALRQSTERLADIANRSQRDIEDDRLIVPAKFIREFQAMTRQREQATHDI